MHKGDENLIAAHAANTQKPAPHQVQRWHDAIDAAAALERGHDAEPSKRGVPRLWFWGAAVTVALLAGVVIGLQMPEALVQESENTFVQQATSEPSTPVAFTRGLSLHLRESQQHINEFDSSGDSAQLIRQIIEQNRIFETAADQHNADKVARVLRAFEPILLRLAADDIAPEDAAALQSQLAFELKIMLTKLAQQPSDQSHST